MNFLQYDTQSLAIFRGYGLEEADLMVLGKKEVERVHDHDEPPTSYKIECKCGAEYFCKLSKNKYRARCRECGATVFTDRTAEKEVYPTTGEKATLITNRYFVEKEQQQPHEDTHEAKLLKAIDKNFRSGYVDPCNLAI